MKAEELHTMLSEPPNSNVYHDVSIPSRFKFKSKGRTPGDLAEPDLKRHGSRIRTQRSIDFRNESGGDHRRKRRRKAHHGRTKTLIEEVADRCGANPEPTLDPDVAFREALFDAMADDEGAAYWEGVYDQPLHIYPNTKPGPDGELEQMSDEEYTSYVRARMYEKTHQHIIEERQRREEARQRQRTREKASERLEDDRRSFQIRMEGSLRRGEERKSARLWKEAWSAYLKAWDHLNRTLSSINKDDSHDNLKFEDIIPWPVKSRKMADVGKDEVEAFFKNAPREETGGHNTRSGLKAERVRWHPDKMQQRFGSRKIEVKTMKAVTSVFQVIDKLYGDFKAEP